MVMVDRLSWALFFALACVAGALAAIMMVTTFSDVVMRYFFNRPIGGAFEVTEISMGLIVFFALPLMIRERENIVVTILYDRFPAPLRRAATTITDLVCAALCGFIAWRMWLYGERLLRANEITLELRVPKGAVAQSMSVLLFVAGAAFVICALRALTGADDGAVKPLENQEKI
jgi:TRAP-type transport system small permease protein